MRGRSDVRARHAAAGPLSMAALALLSAGAIGCAEQTRTIHLLVTSDLLVPRELDELHITVTASRTPEGNVCMPVPRQFLLNSQEDLPLRVHIEIGEEYSEWAAIRVVGRQNREGLLVRETRVPWPEEGAAEVELELQAACLDVECAEGSQCVNATCVGVPALGILDDPSFRDEGISCDRAAPAPEDQ